MKKNSSPTTKGTPIKLDGINHFALNVRNMDRAVAFYTGILGFPVINRTETRGGLKHVEVDAGNVAIALFESPDLDLEAGQKIMTDDGYLHYAYSAPADRMDDIIQALKDSGVKMDGEPRNHSVYFFDPDGHQIEIHFDK